MSSMSLDVGQYLLRCEAHKAVVGADAANGSNEPNLTNAAACTNGSFCDAITLCGLLNSNQDLTGD